MARRKTQTIDEAAAEAGAIPPAAPDHNGPTESDFLAAVSAVTAANAKVAEAQSARQAVRKKFKAIGIELGHLDAVIRLAEWDRDELQSHFATQRRYAEWMKLDIGTQGALFGDEPKTDPAEDDEKRVYDLGYTAGILGKGFGVPPDTISPANHQSWMKGWTDAQAKLGEAIKSNRLAPEAVVAVDLGSPGGDHTVLSDSAGNVLAEDEEIPGFLRRLAGAEPQA